jgi:RNA polymerase sigma factor (sigma-70 family)
LLHVARSFGGGHDAVMDRYAFILERLRSDDYRRLESWASDRRSKLTTWLVIVAQRLSLDQNRQRYGRPRNQTEPDPTRATRRRLADLLGVVLDLEAGPSSDAEDPDTALRRAELAGALAQSVAELSPADQLLLTLRFQDELAATEIARTLGYPSPFHVYRHINRLLDQLRRALRRRGVDDPNP